MQKTKLCKSCGKPLYYSEIKKRYYYHEKCFFDVITIEYKEDGTKVYKLKK